jgi:TPR repeat protein
MSNNFIHKKVNLKKFSTYLLLLVFFFLGPSHVMADFEEGLFASRKGDYVTAFREFRRLAEKGHAKAQLHMGMMYEMGLGIKQDLPEAAKWYQRAAIQGDRDAQKKLVEMRDKGLTNTYPPPVPNFYRGNTTDPQVQYDLGVMYFKGIGVKNDPKAAYRWFHMAAIQEHTRAQNDLAVMLSRGIGVRQNNSEAYVWFLKAAEQNYADSQFNLGILLSGGNGNDMPQHIVLAYMWFEIAAQNGILEARKRQVLLAKQMQEDQIEEAKIQARKWLSKYGSTK